MLLDEIVQFILKKIDPEKIVIFGSAVRQDYRRTSDIDIALFGVGKVTAAEIEDYLNENLPTLKQIDVLGFENLDNDQLKKRILEEGQIIYERSLE